MKTNKAAPRFLALDDADLDHVTGGFGGAFNPMDGFKSWWMGSQTVTGSDHAPTGDGGSSGSTNWGGASSSGSDAMGNSTGGSWGDSSGGWGGDSGSGGDSSGGGGGDWGGGGGDSGGGW